MRIFTHITSVVRKLTRCHCLAQRKLLPSTIIIICFIITALPIINLMTHRRQRYQRASVRNAKTSFSDQNDVKYISDTCKRYPPKAIVFGVSKCGTGALRMFLSAHPEIDNAPVKDTPEHAVNYFDLHYEEGLKWYIKQMPCSEPDRMIIDHTPQYFRKDYVPKRVYKFNSNVKLVLIVREPISRTVSQYLQMKALRPQSVETIDIDSFLMDKTGTRINVKSNAIVTSTYFIELQKWLDFFRLEQMYILDGTEMLKNPLRQLQELENFLGVKPYFNSEIIYFNATRGLHCVRMYNKEGGLQCGSPGKGREHPKLKDSTFNLLKEYFEPYNKKLFDTIGKRFNWT